MIHNLKLSLLLAACLFVSAGLPAAEPSKLSEILGTWTLETPRPDGQVFRSTLIIRDEGGQLKATSITERGEFQPSQIKYHEGELTMVYTFERDGRSFQITYRARPSGDKMAGKGEFTGGDQPRTFEFTGVRISKPTQIAGTWKLRLSLPDGGAAEPTVTITEEGGVLKGKYHSSRFGELPVSEVRHEGGKLSFKVSGTSSDGNVYSIVYRGDLSGQSIKGKAEFDFNGQTGSLDFEGRREASAG